MKKSVTRKLLYNYLGEVSYGDGLEIQQNIQEKLISGVIEEAGVILFLYHNPVITTGKHGNDDNLLMNIDELRKSGVEYFRTTRGGDATYHGPGQLVCYPIVNLRILHLGIRKYISLLEKVIMEFLSGIGIQSTTVEGLHGVWVGNEKIASVGVRVRRHITMHGFALNVSNDLGPFQFINPCGMEGASVTSVKKILGKDYELNECVDTIMDHMCSAFGVGQIEELRHEAVDNLSH